MSQANVDLFRQAIAAFNRRDRDAWLALCDPEYENVPPRNWPESAPLRGREEIWDFFTSNMEPWEDFTFELAELIDAGNVVVAEQKATVRGKSSRADVVWTYWHVVTFQGRKAVRSEWFADRREALEAAGLSD